MVEVLTSNSIPSTVKRIQAQQSQLISDDEEDEWEVIAEYSANHQQAMDAHEIAHDIFRHAEKIMHARGTVIQADYVGKPDSLPEDLYPWCLILQSKKGWEYACLMCYFC